jgi:NitT/TauT family transport system substrate-binding protein
VLSITLRRSVVASLIALAALVIPTPRGDAQELTTVTVAAPPVDDATPVLYALHAGLFKKAGLNVQLSSLASGAAVSAAVVGGSVQIGNSSMLPLISAHVRGVPFRLVAADGLYSDAKPYALMIVRKDSPYHSGRDLNGKVLSSPALKDLIWTANSAWIEKNGGDLSTVKMVEVPNSAIVPAIEEGRVDASTILEPRLAEALAGGKTRVLGKSFSAIAPRFLISAWFTTSSYASEHPDVVSRFAKVVADAAAYANTHQSETAPLLAEFGKVDQSVITRGTREQFATSLDPKDLQPEIDAAVKYKVITRAFSAKEMM